MGGPSKGNAGDTALWQAFRYLFKKEFHGSKVSFMNCRKDFTIKDIHKVNKADALFICGGGLFLYDSYPNLLSDWQWGISEDLLEEIEVPIVVHSVGFNKFRGQLDFNENFNKTVAKLLEKSTFFSLRNTGSCNAIKQYVPESLHNRIKLNYCPTLLFSEAFNVSRNTRDSNTVGFIVAGDRIKNRHKDLNKYISNMKKFVDYLKSQGKKSILINHSDDTWLENYIDFDSFISLWGRDSKYIYKTYSMLDTVVGDRGHAQMIPFACGCRILTPISHNKLRWFLEDMDLQEFGIEESDNDLAEKLIEKYNILQNIPWTTIHQEKMSQIREKNTRNMTLIKEHLGQ